MTHMTLMYVHKSSVLSMQDITRLWHSVRAFSGSVRERSSFSKGLASQRQAPIG